jgi:hemerythrin
MQASTSLVRAPALYDIPHRGLRWALARILQLAGTTDYTDVDSLAALQSALGELARLTEQHMLHEERYLHGPLRERGSALYLTLEEEHTEHRRELACLTHHLAALKSGELPAARSRELVLALSRFVASDLEHMDHEEGNAQALFEELFSQAELVTLHQQLVSSLPPDEISGFLKIILPGMHHRDRVELLSGPRAAMPANAFRELLTGALGYLNEDERHRLVRWSQPA